MKNKDRFINGILWSLVISFWIGIIGLILIVIGILIKSPIEKIGIYTASYCLVETKNGGFLGRDCKIKTYDKEGNRSLNER